MPKGERGWHHIGPTELRRLLALKKRAWRDYEPRSWVEKTWRSSSETLHRREALIARRLFRKTGERSFRRYGPAVHFRYEDCVQRRAADHLDGRRYVRVQADTEGVYAFSHEGAIHDLYDIKRLPVTLLAALDEWAWEFNRIEAECFIGYFQEDYEGQLDDIWNAHDGRGLAIAKRVAAALPEWTVHFQGFFSETIHMFSDGSTKVVAEGKRGLRYL